MVVFDKLLSKFSLNMKYAATTPNKQLNKY